MKSMFGMDSPMMRMLSKISDLVILNLLFIITCIPVVTIGPALTALYCLTLKMAKNEEGVVWRSYLQEFRKNFKISFYCGMIMLAVAGLIFVDYHLVEGMSGMMKMIFRMVLVFGSIFYLFISLYLYPCIAKFENSIQDYFRNALYMSIGSLPFTLLMAALVVGSILLTFSTLYTIIIGAPVWIFAGFSLIAYVNSVFLNKVFKKYIK